MQKFISLLLFVFTFSFISAQEDFEASTLRIGPYKIDMEKSSVEKVSRTKVSHTGESSVTYKGESIRLLIDERYINEKNTNAWVVYGIITKSRKFRTKSGVGVGSTKDEVINAYKNFQSFRAYPAWSETGEKLKNENYFAIVDGDAGTELTFRFVNNIVTEISVFLNEGC
ncbi:hypothetical protein [Chryseobacterium sp.]|uniref:hypothetical protein n=1 Tax=Chryseobacterium sp. TaxID=1871047 RepID=UPI0025C2D662|nr:hypothetical protein [Chryseobacterium sp.]